MSTSGPQNRRQPRENRWRRFSRDYRFEIIWAAVVALGLFLILERFSIRQALRAWIETLMETSRGSIGRLADVVLRFLAATTLSDVIGFVLIAGALAAIVLRVRWRLLHSPQLASLQCPECGSDLHRVHRRKLDHLINAFVPVRRYRCSNRECGWRGLRVGWGHHTTHTSGGTGRSVRDRNATH